MSEKFTFVISEKLRSLLREESSKLGLNESELVRRALVKDFNDRGVLNHSDN